MDYCGPRGLSLAKFRSWPRDAQDAALGWELHQRQIHGPCGTRPDEWDPDRGGSDTAYRAEFRGCRGCEVIASAEKQMPKDAPAGARVVLVRNT